MASRLHAHIGTFRQLEILLALHQHRSVTAAADALHLTQPTVSMQLKKLSEAVGLPLYEQVGRRLIFTDPGKAVVASAREVLDCLERLDMSLADFKGLRAGTLRLAVVSTAKYFIPHLLGAFCKRYLAIDIEFKVGNRQQIIDRIDAGEDDLYVFSHPPVGKDLELQEFLPNPLVAIAPMDHPLTRQKSVSLAQFAAQPFLIREAGSGTRHAIEQHLRRHGHELNIRMTIESNEAIKHAVMSGLGVSILSSHTLSFGGRTGLSELQVEQLPIASTWHLARLRSKRVSIVAKTFMDYVNSQGRAELLDALERDAAPFGD